MMRPSVLAGSALLALSLVAGVAAQAPSPLATSPFESYLELLRQQAGIPGISAAIVQNGEIVWERGLGFQNVDARLRATPDTPYPISNLSATLAATLILQCVEERRVFLDDPAATYGVSLPRRQRHGPSAADARGPRPPAVTSSATTRTASRSSGGWSRPACRSRIGRPSPSACSSS